MEAVPTPGEYAGGLVRTFRFVGWHLCGFNGCWRAEMSGDDRRELWGNMVYRFGPAAQIQVLPMGSKAPKDPRPPREPRP